MMTMLIQRAKLVQIFCEIENVNHILNDGFFVHAWTAMTRI